MIWQNTPYTIPLITVIFFALLGIFYIWVYRKGPSDIVGIVVMIFSIIWMASYLFEQGFVDYHMKIFWNKIQYTGSTFIPVVTFLLIAYYAGFKKFLKVRNIIIISAIPIINLFLILTNELHKLVWKDAKLIVFDSFSIIAKEYNTWHFIFMLYTYILILTGIIIIFYSIIKSFIKPSGENRWKNFLLIPYISIPWLIILFKTLGVNFFPAVEEIPVVIALSTLAVVVILNRTRIREIMPMAFNTVFENMKDGIILLDKKDNILKINQASQKIFNSSLNKVAGKPMGDLLAGLENKTDSKISLENEEMEIGDKDNPNFYNTKQSEIKSDRGRHLGKVVVLRDITKIRKAEENIKYLSFHDKLTKLYNRANFDFELKRLDVEIQLPLSIVIGDINGLKIINDAFGHKHGDKLLCRVADILAECFRKEDIVARWGGDEFSIILPCTSLPDTLKIVDKVYQKCKEESTDFMPLNISMGCAAKENISKSIKDVIKEAEDSMFRHKLIENKSARSSIITSLEKALEERDYETKEHTTRMKKNAVMFGKALKLPGSKLDDLSLLATLHDIGKIGIPDNIILKPAKLTPEEFDIIKKHAEIGYRIALSSPELLPIAEAILHHHERWDGKGYPYGLKQEKIPFISRMISIVDTYDAMISDRPYKKALSKEAAINEFYRCSGSQFDPDLLDVFVNSVLKN